ncbi:MAG: septum formation initiator family protein [Acidimicrobiia bacterium]|nr:septum formation initiator family protein [Acidimicrobiia bacterium]
MALASLALAAVLLLFVFPTRSLIAQRGDIDRARDDLEVIETENARLAEEAARLATPAEIERIARERFHMVRPGETAFAVVPTGDDPGADPGSEDAAPQDGDGAATTPTTSG